MLPMAKKLHRLIEHRSAPLGGSLHFFKPKADLKLIALRVTRNRFLLYFKGDSFSLFCRGNSYVSNVALHVGELIKLKTAENWSLAYRHRLSIGRPVDPSRIRRAQKFAAQARDTGPDYPRLRRPPFR